MVNVSVNDQQLDVCVSVWRRGRGTHSKARGAAANQDSHETGRHRGQEVKGERGCKQGGDGNLQGGLGQQQQPVGLCSLCWRSQVQKGLCVCPVLGGQTGEATSADVYTLNLPTACEDHILTVWGQRRAGWENQWDGEKEERQIIDKEECWVKEKMKDWSCRLSDVRQDCRVSSPIIKKKEQSMHYTHTSTHVWDMNRNAHIKMPAMARWAKRRDLSFNKKKTKYTTCSILPLFVIVNAGPNSTQCSQNKPHLQTTNRS